MADRLTPAQRSQVMSRIKNRGNQGTEVRMVAIFRQHGLVGWRRHQPVFGRPDFVFREARVAIFVDGCFWHCCPQHGHLPATNQAYWLPKLARNRRRDRLVGKTLRTAGWKVLRFWQHALASDRDVAHRVRAALRKPAQGLLLCTAAATIWPIVFPHHP